jgi:hypothetical protein
MNVSGNSNEFPLRDLDDQEVWRVSVGLDLTDRTVLEAEVLMWRIVRQRIARQTPQPVMGAEEISNNRHDVQPDISHS